MRAQLVACVLAGGFLAGAACATQPETSKAYLLHVTKGQLPSDTGTEATKVSIEDHAELGKALKVVLADSFGVKNDHVRNWKPYEDLVLTAINPAAEPVTLNLTIRHKRSTNYQTRVDQPIT